MPTCTIHNGTYACMLILGHHGMHRAEYISAGVPMVAVFQDAWSQVFTYRRNDSN